MKLSEFQKLIYDIYYKKDSERGIWQTFGWFVEEIGELSRAMQTKEDLEKEFADVCAWLFQLATMNNIDMEKAVKKYKNGCPKCCKMPCECNERSFHKN